MKKTLLNIFLPLLISVAGAVSVSDLYHNDDYILIYSDSGHYYSEYREPQAGTFTVNNVGNGFFMVEFDFSLADGKPLKMDFFNEMQDGSVE